MAVYNHVATSDDTLRINSVQHATIRVGFIILTSININQQLIWVFGGRQTLSWCKSLDGSVCATVA